MRQLLAALAALCLTAFPASAADIVVPAGTEAAALKAAKPGDRLLFAPGARVDVAGLNLRAFAPALTLTSADSARPARVIPFSLGAGTGGLVFTSLELAATKPTAFNFIVNGGRDIAFDRVSVHGSLDGDPSNDPSGIQVLNSTGVSLTNSELQQLARGAAFGTVSTFNVSGNYVHDIRSDGFDFAEVSNGKVTGNFLQSFSPAIGDHPDAIQFWTAGTKTASQDVEIRGNLLMKGSGTGGFQGVFMGDEVGTLPFTRFTIAENLIVCTGTNALRMYRGKDLTLTDNELVTCAGGDKTYPLLQLVDGVTSSGNKAVLFGYDRVTGLVRTGDVTTVAVTDGGKAALDAWLAARGKTEASLAAWVAAPAPTPVDARDATIADLAAQVAALSAKLAAAEAAFGKASEDLATAQMQIGALTGQIAVEQAAMAKAVADLNATAALLATAKARSSS